MTVYPNLQNLASAAIPVWVTGNAPGGGITPAAGTNVAVAAGGTAVVAVTGPANGGYITNPPNLASQGIGTAENLYVDMVASPGSTDAAANGTTSLLLPGGSFTVPALATGQVIKVNAATSGHKFTAVVW